MQQTHNTTREQATEAKRHKPHYEAYKNIQSSGFSNDALKDFVKACKEVLQDTQKKRDVFIKDVKRGYNYHTPIKEMIDMIEAIQLNKVANKPAVTKTSLKVLREINAFYRQNTENLTEQEQATKKYVKALQYYLVSKYQYNVKRQEIRNDLQKAKCFVRSITKQIEEQIVDISDKFNDKVNVLRLYTDLCNTAHNKIEQSQVLQHMR